MRIVMIEDFFHPEAGYQCNILSRYLTAYGHEVVMVTSEMEKMPDKYKDFFGCEELESKDEYFSTRFGIKIVRIPLKSHISGRSIYDSQIYRVVDALNPDILYVHGNDTYIGIRYIMRQGRLRYPIISDNHMIEIATNNRLSKYFKLFYKVVVTPRIIKYGTRIIRTVDIDFVNKYYGIPYQQTPFIGFGSDVRLFHESIQVRKQKRRELGISENAFVFVYAGKLDEKKGGLFFAEAIKNRFLADKEIVFVIVGNTIGEYGEKTEKVFSESENKIIRFPTQRYIDLPQYFQLADVTVYPKQCSLSFYDSTACGAPALVEDNQIGLQRSKETGCLTFKAMDQDDFRSKLQEYINMSSIDFERIRANGINYILTQYNYEKQAEKYEKLLQQVVSEHNSHRRS